ncbi:MAG TPA: hypothetical protein VFN30_12795 [Chitinophagaceae bacterium]|nr:hypothetical protein [Chitinophagaceae bacterium]
MNFDAFMQTLKQSAPPADFSVYLQSLWYDGKGNWHKAHTLIQEVEDKTGSWIHAYLHRKEGDNRNANYWYGQAGKPMPHYTLKQEWEEIVKALL